MRRFLWTAFAVGDAAWDTASAIAQFASTAIRIRFVRFWGVGVTEKIDTTTAAGRMVFRMLAVLSEFERDQIAERTTNALAHKKAQGQVYSALPLGYADQDGKLVPIDEELRVVAEIKAMRNNGKTLRDIADDLNGRGIVGKRGGKYHASTIKAVLANSLHQ